MDQPQIHMRRHNSLPAKRTSSSLFLRNASNRFNPHVGTFRHAPPTASHALELNQTKFSSSASSTGSSACNKHFMLSDKNCPYIGSFRHAPAYSNKSWLASAICELISSAHEQKMFSLSELLMVSGHLRGGGPYWRRQEEETDWAIASRMNRNQSSGRAGNVVSSALVKIACWVLFGEQPSKSYHRNKPQLESSLHSRQESLSDDSSISTDHTDSDENSCCAPTSATTQAMHESSSLSNLTLVSSQAEAYYAHAMVNKETTTPDMTDDEVIQNLDYTVSITQMDVMRMMRNASRHLDVQSIVQLPVITYQQPDDTMHQADDGADDGQESSSTGSFTSVDDSTSTPEEMSWLLIKKEEPTATGRPASSSGSNKSATSRSGPPNAEKNDCMCVICLEQFVAGDRLRVLPCNHSFHVGCIDRWLSGSSSFDECITSGCPTCKKRPDIIDNGAAAMDGSVPSWAFANIGNALAASQMG